jgi:hypothetical protein
MLLRQLVPYPDVDANVRVVNGVAEGRLDLRTSLPTAGSPVCLLLAALARQCLDPTPQRRPTATELVIALTNPNGVVIPTAAAMVASAAAVVVEGHTTAALVAAAAEAQQLKDEVVQLKKDKARLEAEKAEAARLLDEKRVVEEQRRADDKRKADEFEAKRRADEEVETRRKAVFAQVKTLALEAEYNVPELKQAIEDAMALGLTSIQLREQMAALELAEVVIRVKEGVNYAIASKRVELLQSAIVEARKINLDREQPEFLAPALQCLESLIEHRTNLRAAVAARFMTELTSCLELGELLGVHTSLEQEGREILMALKALAAEIEAAIAARELAPLQAAVKKAISEGMQETESYIVSGQALIAVLIEEAAATAHLVAALASKRIAELRAAVARAKPLNLPNRLAQTAEELVTALVASQTKLVSVIDTRVLAPLQEAMQVALDVGLHPDEEGFAIARDLIAVLVEEEAATRQLVAALASHVIEELQAAVTRAQPLNLPGDHYQQACVLLDTLVQWKTYVEQSLPARDLAQLNEAMAQAKDHGIKPTCHISCVLNTPCPG